MKLDRRREALLRQTFVDFWQMEKFIERPRILDRAQVWIVKTNVDCGISILKPQAICSNLSASVSRLIVREPFGSFANGYVSIL